MGEQRVEREDEAKAPAHLNRYVNKVLSERACESTSNKIKTKLLRRQSPQLTATLLPLFRPTSNQYSVTFEHFSLFRRDPPHPLNSPSKPKIIIKTFEELLQHAGRSWATIEPVESDDGREVFSTLRFRQE